MQKLTLVAHTWCPGSNQKALRGYNDRGEYFRQWFGFEMSGRMYGQDDCLKHDHTIDSGWRNEKTGEILCNNMVVFMYGSGMYSYTLSGTLNAQAKGTY